MPSLSIEFCDDVRSFIHEEFDPLVNNNDCVVQLGSGDGRFCYELSALAGSGGRIIGLEPTEETVYGVFKNHHQWVEDNGHDNVFFFHNSGVDLRSDLYRQSSLMKRKDLNSVTELQTFLRRCDQYFDANPVIEDNSVDVILSTVYLSEFSHANLADLAHEFKRVLKPNGRVSLLMPAAKTQAGLFKLTGFFALLTQLGLNNQSITDHWVSSACCSEKHYLMMKFSTAVQANTGADNLLIGSLKEVLAPALQTPKTQSTECEPGVAGCC